MSKLVGFMFLVIVMHFLACQTKQVSQEGNDPSGDTIHVRLEQITGGLENPVYITHAGDGSKRLFILQQSGEILIDFLSTHNQVLYYVEMLGICLRRK